MSNITTGAYFKRLSLDETLRRTMVVYWQGFGTFTKLAGVLVLTSSLVWAAALTVLVPFVDMDISQLEDPFYLADHLGAFYGLLGIKSILDTLVGALAMGAMVRAVADIYLQRPPSMKDCISLSVRHMCPILLSSFLAGIAVVFGYILLFLPGLYLAVIFYVAKPAIVIEGVNAVTSLQRSSELVAGNWCYVFCTFFIASVVMLVFQMIWGQLVVGGNDAGHTLFSVKGSLIAAVPTIFYIPIMSIMMTIMYINLRVEKEGMNADALACSLGESTGDTTYSPLVLDEEDVPDEHV